MEPAAYLESIRSEGARLGEAARAAGLQAAVPACPGWSIADLLQHTALVYRRMTFVVTTGARERPSGDAWRRAAPDPDEVPAWFDEELDAVVSALSATDPTTPMWTWWQPEQRARFWFRRMAHETVVHRADAEAARGALTPVRTELARDGVDEALDLFLAPNFPPGSLDGPPATVHLHATDGAGEWLVGLGPDGVTVERGHAKGDAAVRGTASELLLWLWGRAPTGDLELFGDVAQVARLRDAAAVVT
ncbi:MAG: maleylpyruvate isomerase family mycothiol-dependent enzyme [Acidimicrobiales bacterium]